MIKNLTDNAIKVTTDTFEPFIAMQIFALNRIGIFLSEETELAQNAFNVTNSDDFTTYCFSFYDEQSRDLAIAYLLPIHSLNYEKVRKSEEPTDEACRQIVVSSINNVLSYKSDTLVRLEDEKRKLSPSLNGNAPTGNSTGKLSYMQRFTQELNTSISTNTAVAVTAPKVVVETKVQPVLLKVSTPLNLKGIINLLTIIYVALEMKDIILGSKSDYTVDEDFSNKELLPYFLLTFKEASIAQKASNFLSLLIKQRVLVNMEKYVVVVLKEDEFDEEKIDFN